jgi:hypothetical protein
MNRIFRDINESEGGFGASYVDNLASDEVTNALADLGSRELKNIPGQALGTTAFDKKAHDSQENARISMDTGWIPISSAVLPSQGKYYPDDIKISVRAADAKEIKYFSQMTENDMIDTDDKISFVFNKCLRLVWGGAQKTPDYLKEADKIFFLFTIRDLSMKAQGREVKMWMPTKCPHCGQASKIELTNNVFGYYDIPSEIMQYYNDVSRCFIIPLEDGMLQVHIPNMGVMRYLKEYIITQEQLKRQGGDGFYNKQALTFMQFLSDEPRLVTEDKIKSFTKELAEKWSLERVDAMNYLADNLAISVKPNANVPCKTLEGEGCGKMFPAPIVFPNGIRSILNITGVVDKLFQRS